MKSWSNEQKMLVAMPPVLVLSQIIVFQLLMHLFGDTWGYLLGYVVYWLAWCIPFSILFLPKKRSSLWRYPKDTSPKITHSLALVLVALPVFATGIAVFSHYAPLAGWGIILLALLFSLINAPLEEILWRGVFPSCFPHHRFFGFLYPTVCFGLWHFAPALARDSGMEGGLLSFVGGALFMGGLWGWYAYRYKTVLPTVVSHIFTNLFAFTGFLYVNWFA